MNNKIVILTDSNIDSSYSNDKLIYLIGIKKQFQNNCEIDLPKYFIRAHKSTRELNKILLLDSHINIQLHLSLMKLSDQLFFDAIRIIEIVKDLLTKHKKIYIKTKSNKLISLLINLMNLDNLNIEFIEVKYKSKTLSNLQYIIYGLLLYFNSFRVKQYSFKNIFIMFNDKVSFEFAKPYLDKCIIYPIYDDAKMSFKPKNYIVNEFLGYKFITFRFLKKSIFNYYKNKNIILSSNIPHLIQNIYLEELIKLELNSSMIFSLIDKFKNLKNIIGIFDANPFIDYITYNLNKYNIKTICIPHGVNYKYKVSYISYGVNKYTLWSKNHLEIMEDNNLIDKEVVNKVLTGNIVYKNTLTYLKKQSYQTKNILVVGEYFADKDFYTSPFNLKASKKLFDLLSDFLQYNHEINITIRTRLSDGYYTLAKKYVDKYNNIQISSPNKSIIDEINQNDLIISVFSNALHEALLLEKQVLQVNFLEIENYRDLAEDGLVHYATTESQCLNILFKWKEGKLPELDFNKHLEKYANNGVFTKLKL
jgi:hypothetical protein